MTADIPALAPSGPFGANPSFVNLLRRARPEAMAGSHFSFWVAEPPRSSGRPPSTTVARKGPG